MDMNYKNNNKITKNQKIQVDIMSNIIPLVIDLDGTLYRSDSLLEGLLQLLRTHPCRIIEIIRILLSGGKAELKQYLASYSLKTLDHQPLNPAVREYMLLSRAEGCPLYLATAADISVAEDVAGRFGFFDGVFASSVCAGKGVNLRGDVKAARLVQEFGEHGFDYIGDDLSDLDVWVHCRKAVLVGGNRRILRKAKAAGLSLTELSSPEADIGVYLRALRSRQWVKNLLLGVPAFLMHVYTPEVLLRITLAFIAFCACASVVYLLNDLLDLPADRLHPSKKNRPFASGILPLRPAFFCPRILPWPSASISL
jgi:phosphoserine phosphatase